jgi:hypothetical protein
LRLRRWLARLKAWSCLVAADVCLAKHQNWRRLRLAGALSEGVQQAENAGVRERDSKSYGSSDGEGDYKRDQQTPQVRPTFPSDPAAAINGPRSGFSALFSTGSGALSLYPR